MLPHEKRVIDEKQQLDEKYSKLYVFIGSDTYRDLPVLEQILLVQQLTVMGEYSTVLSKRIEFFGK